MFKNIFSLIAKLQHADVSVQTPLDASLITVQKYLFLFESCIFKGEETADEAAIFLSWPHNHSPQPLDPFRPSFEFPGCHAAVISPNLKTPLFLIFSLLF